MNNINIYIRSLEFFGGGEQHVLRLAKLLNDFGYDISIYGDRSFDKETRVSTQFIQENLVGNYSKIEYCNYYPRYIPKFLKQPLPPVEDFIGSSVNIVFLYRPPPRRFLNELGEKNSRAVLMFHGISMESKLPFNILVRLYSLYVKWSAKANTFWYSKSKAYFHVINSDTKYFFSNLLQDSSRIFLFPQGIKTSLFLPIKNDKLFEIVFVGRLSNAQKGIKRLIKTINRISRMNLPDVVFHIIGSGPMLRRLESEFSDNSSVKVHGFLNENEKISLQSKCNLSLITSNIEPFSLSLVESLCCGTPVVTTPVSGPRYIFSLGNDFGKISTFSVSTITREIINYYKKWKEDKTQYFTIRSSISNQAKEIFSEELYINRFRELLDEVENSS